MHCWGRDKEHGVYKWVSGVPAGVKFMSVSSGVSPYSHRRRGWGEGRTCGVEAGGYCRVYCWGQDLHEQADKGLMRMGGLNLLSERSCALQHPELTEGLVDESFAGPHDGSLVLCSPSLGSSDAGASL